MDKIKSFFGILFLTTCISSAFCQNAGVTTIGSTFACPGTSFVVLPLNITNSPPITAISMKIYYDAAVLSYRQNGIINKNPGLTPLFSSSQSSYGSTYKQLRISWYDVTAHIVDTNGTGKIADIVFRYLGGSTSVIFDNSSILSSMCEYADSNGMALIDTPSTAFYQNGLVTQGFIPTDPGPISGNINPCLGSNETYSVVDSPWVSYLWTAPASWSGSSSSNSITYQVGTFGSGLITVTPSNICGLGPGQSIYINENGPPLMPGSITGASNPCLGNYETYLVPSISGVFYTWTAPSSWTGTSSGNSITYLVGNFNTGVITVTPSNICGQGPGQSIFITSNSPPLLSGNIVGNVAPCTGNFETYIAPFLSGVTYTWTAPNFWSGSSTGNSITYLVTSNLPGLLTVTPSNVCGTGTPLSLFIYGCNIGITGIPGNSGINAFIFPNPVKDQSSVVFDIPENGRVTIELFNILGEHLSDVFDGFYASGRHEILYNPGPLPSGMYNLRIIYRNKEKIITKNFKVNISR